MNQARLKKLRSISEALFGAKHRLPMADAIASAEEGDLYAAALAPRAHTSEVQAGAELRHFERAGLLQLAPPERPKAPGRPPKRYERLPSAFWDLAPKLAKETPRKRRSPRL